MPTTDLPERILCAAIYVDTGKPARAKASHNYPETGQLFCGWRHGDCFTSLYAWSDRLWFWERWAIDRVQPYQLRGCNQGFLTSTGRYVDRQDGYQVAKAAGQLDGPHPRAWGGEAICSEDLY